MSDGVTIAIISAVTTVVTTFGSIILTRYLDRRDQEHEQEPEPPTTPAPVATEPDAATEPVPAPPRPAPGRRKRRVVTPTGLVIFVAATFAYGLLTGWIESGDPPLWFWIGLGAIAFFLARHAFLAGRQRCFVSFLFALAENLAVWAAFATGYLLLYGGMENFLAPLLVCAVPSATLQLIAVVVGAIFFHRRRRTPSA